MPDSAPFLGIDSNYPDQKFTALLRGRRVKLSASLYKKIHMENKWWEYYAVRYFVGTVIGAVVIAYLNSEPNSPFAGQMTILGDSKEANFLGIGLVAALGFAFCYIASAPVLVLHAARAHMRRSTIQTHKIQSGLALVLPPIIVWFVCLCVLPSNAAIVIGLVVGSQLGLLCLAISTNFKIIENFYRDLAKSRAAALLNRNKKAKAGAEYVTSYRHLREHGNAFLIILFEGLLAYALVRSPSLANASIVIAVWIAPAAVAWLVGTVLESRFVAQPIP